MNIAIIVAAGESNRMKTKIHKMLLPIHGKPLLYYTIAAFYDHDDINEVVLVINESIKKGVRDLVKQFFNQADKKISVVLGGKSRPESVMNGMKSLKKKAKKNDVVLIHNGANPLVSYEEISYCIKAVEKKGACIVVHKITDTLKEVKKSQIVKTHDRNNFVRAQTPQGFRYDILNDAIKKHGKEFDKLTDDASLVEFYGHPVVHIPASEHNFKITTKKDYEHAKHLMGDLPEDFLVGIGQDSHPFSKKKGLVIGGLSFENENKLEGNSDGDVILHALCNALLQAIGEKSLGAFADKMCKIKGITDSTQYLKKTLKMINKKGFKMNNVGIMVEGKRPKFDPISHKIKENLSKLLNLSIERIGITATTGDNLTSFGQGKGLQCFCMISLKKK